MEFRIYCEGDDGEFRHQGTLEAPSAADAINQFCNLYKVSDHGQFIALAPGESQIVKLG